MRGNKKNIHLIKKRRSFSVIMKKYSMFYLFLLPAVVWYIIFAYYPMSGLIIAFKKFRYSLGFYRSPWVGTIYFQDFLKDPYFWTIIKNTFTISLSKLVFCFPAPIILALMLNAVVHQKYKRVIQTVSYLPHFVSWIVVAALISKFFSPTTGMINDLRIAKGLDPIYYLGRKELFVPFVVLSDMWKGIGYGSIIYLAALSGIDPTLYEAASIDGANGARKLWHITLPGIKATIGILFLLSVGGLLNANMEQILLLQTPSTYKISEIIDTYILKRGLNMNQFDYAAAVSVFRSLFGLVLVVSANSLSKRFSDVYLW